MVDINEIFLLNRYTAYEYNKSSNMIEFYKTNTCTVTIYTVCIHKFSAIILQNSFTNSKCITALDNLRSDHKSNQLRKGFSSCRSVLPVDSMGLDF